MEATTAAAKAHTIPRSALGPTDTRDRAIGWLFVGTGITLFLLMGLLGLSMRLTQAKILHISPVWFYRLMTLHGAGMLTGALLAAMGALWFVLREVIELRLRRVLWTYGTTVAGALLVLVATLVGGFATGWTFLYPLPFDSAGQWSPWATDVFMIGLLLVGVGFFIFCLDVLASITDRYGRIGRSLGIDFLRDRDDSPPPPQVIAGTVVTVEGLLASAVGTTIVIALLSRSFSSSVQMDALWAKNLTYFFGHSIANLIIYLIVGMVYVVLPHYVGRPWKTTKPIVIGWMATLVLVAIAYSHHLYMDFVQPRFAQYVSTTASFTAALPVAVVTIYTGMMLVWGSHYRWTLASTLLYLGFAGWAIGGSAAVLDSIIPFNFRLHNTLWVPAHFHTYLMMGVVMWMLAFLAHLLETAAGRIASRFARIAGPVLMVAGGYGLLGAWYVSGALGVPRRYAVHFGGIATYDVVGSICAIVFALGLLIVLVEFATLAGGARHRRVAVTKSTRPEGPAAVPAVSRLLPPLATPMQLGLGVAAATVALVSLLPPIVEASEVNTQYHHLAHGAYFFLGAIFALAVGSTPAVFERRVIHWSFGAAMAAVIVAPAVMLLTMIPSIYGSIDKHAGLHFLYHVGMIALGGVTGLGAARLGRVVGRIAFVLSVGMAAMYAAGVTGG